MIRRRERLDRLMLERKLVESREKAQALIMAGEVLVAGQKAQKPGQLVLAEASVEVLNRPRYVGRGGLKLEAALVHFDIAVPGKICLDIGSSTGGFTDCLLQAGALRVHAVDVGTAQLDWKLRSDPRVIVHENTNARYLTFAEIGELAGLAVCDVSFISVTLILPAVVPLLQPHGDMVVLIKPQFEVGKGQVGAGGIVRDPDLHREVCDRIGLFAGNLGFEAGPEFETRLMESPILGAEGNREFLMHIRRLPDRGQ
jgi:23S rRNA (cytidine1920-2'-O)/16S rRNA (cytidine1409-2'-O)-methyltransferase